MTTKAKAACTPESQKKEHTTEEQAAWKANMTEDQKIAKIQDKWAAKTGEQKACALHIHHMNKKHHKGEGKDHKEEGKGQKKAVIKANLTNTTLMN